MPKLTREDLFCNAIQTFLEDLTVETNHNEETKYNILRYDLNCLTQNKNKCIQEYELTVPSTIITAYWDRTTSEDGNEETFIDSEPIYANQNTPLLCDFIESFHTYFDPYRLIIGKTTVFGRTSLSYMSIIDLPRIQNIPICDKTLTLKVVYHKSHTPFPRPLTPMEEKDREIQFLETKLKRKINRNKSLSEIIETKSNRAEFNYKRMQKHLRMVYTERGKIENCPVCYEDISSDKLIIPNCFHYICESCVMKCDNCPICRDKYDEYIEFEDDD